MTRSPLLRSIRRVASRRRPPAMLLLALACGGLAGCLQQLGTPTSNRTEAFPNLRPDWRPEVLSSLVVEYAADFATVVEEGADRIEAASDDPEIRRNALLWKLNAIPEMRRACYRPDPLGGLIDAWAFTLEMQQFFDAEGAGADVFGPHQSIAREASAEAVELVEAIAASVTRSDVALEAIKARDVTPWVVTHPLDSIAFARRSTIARFAEAARARGGTLDQLASIEETATSLSSQVRDYAASAGKTARWEVQLLLQERLGDLDLEAVTEDLDSIARAIDRSAAVAERATVVAEATPELVRSERAAILSEVDRQRVLTLDAVTRERIALAEAIATERAAILRAIAEERTAILLAVTEERSAILRSLSEERIAAIDSIEAQRLDTLEWLERRVAEEREELLLRVDALIAEIVERGDTELDATVDTLSLRIVLLIAGLIVIAPIVAHVYARVWPRRPVRPA